ncbi:MAG: ribosome silencing factor [Akkermansiaceae bacterium]|nr:ribosome silencing factor [Akkermansiaceae bacterium]
MTSLELARACAQAADGAKASNIAIYDLRSTSTLTEYAVVCTATSVPHLRAVLRDVSKDVAEQLGVDPVYAERTPQALWSVLDYIDVMVHIMADEVRSFYNLEELWHEENRIS